MKTVTRTLVLEKVSGSRNRNIIGRVPVEIDTDKVNIVLLDRTLPGRGGVMVEDPMHNQIGENFSAAVECAPQWVHNLIKIDEVDNYWWELPLDKEERQFKVGDRVKVVHQYGAIVRDYLGKTGTVESIQPYLPYPIYINFDGKRFPGGDAFNPLELTLISEPQKAFIKIECEEPISVKETTINLGSLKLDINNGERVILVSDDGHIESILVMCDGAVIYDCSRHGKPKCKLCGND